MNKVLVIVGPTAVGKTALSIQLAQDYRGEIISGDSMQVYRTLDIGTAKATMAERQGIPHFLLDVRELQDHYSVADFQQAARQKIAEISQRGHLPIVVGGTGLYIQALLYDFQLGGGLPAAADEPVRQRYEQLAAEIGDQKLWEQLAAKDPLAASKIHCNNRKKVIRALEVLERTGRSIMAPQEEPQPLYDYLMIGLNTRRELLYQRINQRVDLMLQQGLLSEAELLSRQPQVQAAQGIGYKEFFPYFAGAIDLAAAVEQVKQNSRRYAKRQLTWFRNRSCAQWFDLLEDPDALLAIRQLLRDWLADSEA